MAAAPVRVVIMGAAGRDFHNFNTRFRSDSAFNVVAFTATQIPSIDRRSYPGELAGPLYPEGIPIFPESELALIIEREAIGLVVFAYSDVTHSYVMEKAEACLALGADFILLGPGSTAIKSRKPVISVTAVRTGCGKSGVTRFIAKIIKETGRRPVVIRHPMPYGDLLKSRVQRFSTKDDLERKDLTIEEMEEYEPLVEAGITVYAGVDYAEILKEAEEEADIIIWDGGNNDFSFYVPDISFVVADPLRSGDERSYHPGLANVKMADHVIINKAGSVRAADIEKLRESIEELNPKAGIILTDSKIEIENGDELLGKTVLVIEDGPTLTHGGMRFGAGIRAASLTRSTPVNPRPYAVGSIKATLEKYPGLKNLVPAMGYSAEQIKDLETTINMTHSDAVLVASPVDLTRIIEINKPTYRVKYDVVDRGPEEDGPRLEEAVNEFIKALK